MFRKDTFKISGMSCATCSSRIEKKLNKSEGITNASINLVAEKATIQYDSSKIKLSDIISIIENLGYRAKLEESVDKDKEKEQREKEINKLRFELILSVILSSPLIMAMLLTLVNVNLAFLHDQYFQLILATPIQFIIGFRFYKNTYHALKSKSANMD